MTLAGPARRSDSGSRRRREVTLAGRRRRGVTLAGRRRRGVTLAGRRRRGVTGRSTETWGDWQVDGDVG